MFERPLKACDNPACFRHTTALYCCPPCAQAHDGGYEIHAHTPTCNQRAAERGDPDPDDLEHSSPDQESENG